MNITPSYFDEIKNRIDSALNRASQLPESKLNEAAKLFLLNRQYAAAFEALEAKKNNLTDYQISAFMLEFKDEVKKFEQIVSDFIFSIEVH